MSWTLTTSRTWGVNFINVLRAAFILADPKSAKRQSSCQSFFALMGSAPVKATRRTLMKLTLGGQVLPHSTGRLEISPTFYEQLFWMKMFCKALLYWQFGFVIFWQKNIGAKAAIVKIDSITPSFCLRHYVRNGLSYPAEETRPTLCKPTPSSQLGIRSKRTNKHQLLHRIASVKTPLIYNTACKILVKLTTGWRWVRYDRKDNNCSGNGKTH